jgi:biotin carboxylase
VLADIRAVWGSNIRIIQTIEEGNQRLPGVDEVIYIQKATWANMEHFAQRLDLACSQDHTLAKERKAGKVVFMPGWSAFAESAETAVAVDALGLVWPGTEPIASGKLEKIGFKQICNDVGAPTPPFSVLSEEGPTADLSDPATRQSVVDQYSKQVRAGSNFFFFCKKNDRKNIVFLLTFVSTFL